MEKIKICKKKKKQDSQSHKFTLMLK
jgi:hypothetical protein